ncbi:MAG: putative Holliday junction resolvase [Halieaceae bacterium]|jgi:putative Holliday junction resolvase
MAFDFGLRQIGVAVGNCLLETSQPLDIVRARDGVPDWSSIETLLQEWQPDLLLIGDPLNMDGTDSDLGARAQKFSRRLHGRFGLAVALVDERLTSFEAKQTLQAQGHKRNYKTHPADSIAAELILQSWMREQ